MKLTVTSFLRTLVAEHLTNVVEALGLAGGQIVLNNGAYTTSRTFRTQGQRFAVEAVDEGIHFLFDDVGDFTDGALEKWRRLDDGHANRAIAVGF